MNEREVFAEATLLAYELGYVYGYWVADAETPDFEPPSISATFPYIGMLKHYDLHRGPRARRTTDEELRSDALRATYYGGTQQGRHDRERGAQPEHDRDNVFLDAVPFLPEPEREKLSRWLRPIGAA